MFARVSRFHLRLPALSPALTVPRQFLRLQRMSEAVPAAIQCAGVGDAAGGGGGGGGGDKLGAVLPAIDPAAVPASAPPAFRPLAPLSAIPLGLSRATLPEDEGRLIVVRTADSLFHVMGGLCPHAKGELHLGDIETIEGAVCVTCPRHRKKFPGGLSYDCATGAARVKAEPLPEAKFDPSWNAGVRKTLVVEGWLFCEKSA